MGTRSRIATRNADGTFSSIYCHLDGYPSGAGATLIKHYADPAKVAALIMLGNLSVLGEEIGEKHEFSNDAGTGCTAYGRDRGETDVGAQASPDLDALKQLTKDSGGEWLYVWNGHGWQCAQGGNSAFGMPASDRPGDLESVEYWIQREAVENRA